MRNAPWLNLNCFAVYENVMIHPLVPSRYITKSWAFICCELELLCWNTHASPIFGVV